MYENYPERTTSPSQESESQCTQINRNHFHLHTEQFQPLTLCSNTAAVMAHTRSSPLC
jgi:hypothetical protein